MNKIYSRYVRQRQFLLNSLRFYIKSVHLRFVVLSLVRFLFREASSLVLSSLDRFFSSFRDGVVARPDSDGVTKDLR